MNAKDEVIDWLRDAYAMERSLEITLENLSESDKHDEDVKNLAARHLEETREHAQTVNALLEALGADTSMLKTGLGIMTETAKGIGSKMSHDEVIKDLLTSYAMEHFEIACYSALVTAAETAGLMEVADACEQIIADEEEMADLLSNALPQVVETYLTRPSRAKAA
jgi:ferritin-like metal-binding protein YciE